MQAGRVDSQLLVSYFILPHVVIRKSTQSSSAGRNLFERGGVIESAEEVLEYSTVYFFCEWRKRIFTALTFHPSLNGVFLGPWNLPRLTISVYGRLEREGTWTLLQAPARSPASHIHYYTQLCQDSEHLQIVYSIGISRHRTRQEAMDFAGLVVGGVALASLFNSCVEDSNSSALE